MPVHTERLGDRWVSGGNDAALSGRMWECLSALLVCLRTKLLRRATDSVRELLGWLSGEVPPAADPRMPDAHVWPATV